MTTPSQVIRPDIQAMKSYVVDDATGMIKLDVMELPFTMPQFLTDKIAQVAASNQANRYPDPRAPELKAALRRVMDIPGQAEILIGNGSDECIHTIITSIAREGACIVMPEPGFSVFKMCATYSRIKYVGVPHNQDLSLNVEAVLEAIEREQPALTVLIYPNNPTGTMYPREAVERIIRAAPGLVLIDEAYRPYADDSFMPDVLKYPNLIVMGTLSKLGFAGMRVGYAVGAAGWINEFDKVRPVFNVSNLAQAVAVTMLDHIEVFDTFTAQVRAERERMAPLLAALPGVTVFPSAANFLLVRIPEQPGAAAVYEHLKQRKILIKSFHGAHPLLQQCLRLTIGAPHENEAVLAALKEVL